MSLPIQYDEVYNENSLLHTDNKIMAYEHSKKD